MPLEGVSLETLRDALDGARKRRPTERLLAAIIYKQGPSVPTIAEWFDRQPDTVYRWFDRLERLPVAEAVADRPRPGRPAKLDPEQRQRFEGALADSPEEQGYEESEWTTGMVRTFLEDEFGVEYSTRHVRRLLHEGAKREPGADPRT